MPTVKYAISAYVADGTTTDYLITWDYLDDDHITVYVDGTPNADPQANHTFTKLNNTTLRITDGVGGAVVSGAEIEIRRETPLLTRAITFADGSALLAEDLNKNSDYLLYSMQEVLDTVDAAAQDGALAAQVATEVLRDEAEGHKDDAEAAQTASEAARDTTQTYLATVQSDATDADNHRIAAAASEAAASASEVAASASEAAASASEVASATSETNAAASANAAAASEAASNTSEIAAAASEAAAAASNTAASAAQLAAELALDTFTDQYLGASSTAPTTDNDGDALQTGALYWSDVSDAMYVWNGTAWDTLPTSIGIADGATSTQLTLTDTSASFAQKTSFLNGLIIGGYATAPTTPSLGELWYDSINNIMKHWNGSKWVDMSNLFNASGGTVSTYASGGSQYKVHTFTSSGLFEVVSGTSNCDLMIVAGGGSGGAHACPGGGGGGGLVFKTSLLVAGAYTVTVGAGGAQSGIKSSSSQYARGNQGSNSQAFGLTAVGGGAGVTWDDDILSSLQGGSTGGWGQGGSINTGAPTAQQPLQAGDSGTYGYGNRGGDGVYYATPYPGGGGGGAGQVGENSPNGSTAGRGGIGYATTLRGATEYFAGGGAGGGWARVVHQTNRAGGGGIGDSSYDGNGTSWRGFSNYSLGESGNANSGGGGGGAGRTGGSPSYGGAGGSGIVVIRYAV